MVFLCVHQSDVCTLYLCIVVILDVKHHFSPKRCVEFWNVTRQHFLGHAQKHLSLRCVADVFVFCAGLCRNFSFFLSEINGELMILLFPCCSRKGGDEGRGFLFLIAQPLETDWSRRNTPRPRLPDLTMEALIFCGQGASWN